MLLLASLLATAIGTAGSAPEAPEPTVRVRVDSSRHEIIITAGPYHLPHMPANMNHNQMEMGDNETAVQKFEWPVKGWLRGFSVSVTDEHGTPMARDLLHHIILINFDRRQLLYNAAERLGGAGRETGDVSIPKTIGVPLGSGQHLGMYAMWHNETEKDVDGAYMRVVMLWTPSNQNPQPVTAMPLYMDVNLTVGGSNTFDVPPGISTKSHEFVFPISGRLLGVGGHMHDYGSSVRLEDAESGKVLITLVAKRDAEGHILEVPRKLFGVSGDGMRIKANHRYRVVGTYDNPTKQTFVDGAMAHMVGLFVPEDMSRWPAIDIKDAEYQRDITSLAEQGSMAGMGNMDHMHPNNR